MALNAAGGGSPPAAPGENPGGACSRPRPGAYGYPTESVAYVRQTAATTEEVPAARPADVRSVTFRLRKITPNTLRNPFSWIR
ncbi:hypothetical protein GCM10009736_19640 [Actinomadura bangladeshensis]